MTTPLLSLPLNSIIFDCFILLANLSPNSKDKFSGFILLVKIFDLFSNNLLSIKLNKCSCSNSVADFVAISSHTTKSAFSMFSFINSI